MALAPLLFFVLCCGAACCLSFNKLSFKKCGDVYAKEKNTIFAPAIFSNIMSNLLIY